MRFLPPDDDVRLYETVFEDDLLGRKRFSELLSQIVERVEDPMVIAVDGKWGSGKSHFLKRWVGAHSKQNGGNAITIYFDAFEHDYASDPLIALINSLAARLPRPERSYGTKLKEFALKIAKPTAKIGLSVATAGATSALSDIADAGVNTLSNEADKAIESFWDNEVKRGKAVEQFRLALAQLTKASDKDSTQPLVIVIDELDRCRPDFALEILEIIKHFFSVPHVHFVLGISIDALADIVKTRYGVSVDAGAYLRKFVSLTLDLPSDIGDYEKTPAVIAYIKEISKKMALPSEISSEVALQVEILSRTNNISIRDAGRILSHIAILPEQVLSPGFLWGWRHATVTLLIIKIIRPDLFQRIVKGQLHKEDMRLIFDAMPDRINPKTEQDLQNPNYDRKAHWLFGLWCFILSKGVDDPELGLPSFKNGFDSFGFHRELQDVAGQINRDFLSTFRFV